MNVFYNVNGYEYPVDEYCQIYFPLKMEQIVAKVDQEENAKETKNYKNPTLAWPLLVPLLAQLV